MKDYAKIVSKITSTPWMITPEALKMILELTESHMSGAISREDIRVRMEGIDERGSSKKVSQEMSVSCPSQGPIFPQKRIS